jgi:uncharacterized Zn finger protein
MAHFGRTWWGRRFLAALEQFTDPGRLGRGRSYASSGKISEYTFAGGRVLARVRGSINPYFGVYKEPIYRTSVALAPIAGVDWSKVIGSIGSMAGFVTRLLMNDMPDDIDSAFCSVKLHLLPHSRREFVTSCSCPDSINPCKHIAGVTYRLASAPDQDPLVLFELRGLSRAQLRRELETSPLGRILAAALEPRAVPLVPASSFFTVPSREAAEPTIAYAEFWAGARRPPAMDTPARASLPALLVKKGGDYPTFWHQDGSFIGAMEEIYERVRTRLAHRKEPRG